MQPVLLGDAVLTKSRVTKPRAVLLLTSVSLVGFAAWVALFAVGGIHWATVS